jgi:hypothetical protein
MQNEEFTERDNEERKMKNSDDWEKQRVQNNEFRNPNFAFWILRSALFNPLGRG